MNCNLKRSLIVKMLERKLAHDTENSIGLYPLKEHAMTMNMYVYIEIKMLTYKVIPHVD